MVEVDVSDYIALSRRCREAGPEVRREFRQRIREAGKIGRDAARMRALRIHTLGIRSGRHFGRGRRRPQHPRSLRAALAGDIGLDVSGDDVKITVGARLLSGRDAIALPRGIEKGEWSHPVFGHGRVRQIGDRNWFKDAVEARRPEMEHEVAQVLDYIERRLT